MPAFTWFYSADYVNKVFAKRALSMQTMFLWGSSLVRRHVLSFGQLIKSCTLVNLALVIISPLFR